MDLDSDLPWFHGFIVKTFAISGAYLYIGVSGLVRCGV